MQEWFVYAPLGALVGVIAGLLGIGGGIVIVPILVFVFTANGFPGSHITSFRIEPGQAGAWPTRRRPDG